MSATFAQFGNSLHSGRRSLPIVRRRRSWYLLSVVVLVVLGSLAFLRGPTLGIEFTGGSEFQVAGVSDTDQSVAREIVREQVPGNEPNVTVLGQDTMRVQTEQLDSTETAQLAEVLADAYGVDTSAVSTSFVGPVWSSDITQKMAQGVVVFLVLVAITMALYFRDLKASVAAMIALVHDMVVTAAVYGVIGLEITPGTVIGFLTVMGYSLYDTIVIFDKVRENIANLDGQTKSTFSERVELAANQTLVRSVNTSVVALLPVGSILVIGALILGAGTLKDISLALFVGIVAGTYSSIALAPGLLVDLRRREPAIRAHTQRVEKQRLATGSDTGAGDNALSADEADDLDDLDDLGDAPAEDPDDRAEEEGEVEDGHEELDDPGADGNEDHHDAEVTSARNRRQPRRTSRRRRTTPRRGSR